MQSWCEKGKCKGSCTSKRISVCKRSNGRMVIRKGGNQ